MNWKMKDDEGDEKEGNFEWLWIGYTNMYWEILKIDIEKASMHQGMKNQGDKVTFAWTWHSNNDKHENKTMPHYTPIVTHHDIDRSRQL